MQQLPLINPKPRSTLNRLTVALALVLGAALLWAVVAELRFERRTTEKVGDDYLALLSRERLDAASTAFAAAATAALESQVGGRMASPYEQLPPPAPNEISGNPLQCGHDGTASSWFFREDLRDRSFLASRSVPAASATAVQNAVTALAAASLPSSGSFGVIASGDTAMVYAVKYAPFDAPVAVYGLVTCTRSLTAILNSADGRRPADSLVSVMAVIGRDTLIAGASGNTHRLATTDVAGIQLSAYPAFIQPLSGIVIERDAVSPVVLALMLFATLALASTAIVQLIRDRRTVQRQAELITALSHELRTPLAQILLYSETLALDRVKGDDAKRAAAQRIVNEASGLADTVNTVLSLGKPERVNDAVTPVEPVIEAAISGVRALSDARARVAVEVAGSPRVRLSQSALLQALTNLLDNALKFGPVGQTVRVSAASTAGVVRITVQDEGPGIPAEQRDRIWSKYFRINDTEEYPGAGLGLWIVRDIALKAGGNVRADQPEGGGACMVLELPAADT